MESKQCTGKIASLVEGGSGITLGMYNCAPLYTLPKTSKNYEALSKVLSDAVKHSNVITVTVDSNFVVTAVVIQS